MLFYVKADCSYDEEIETDKLFITGQDFKDVSGKLEEYYGEDLLGFEVELVGPDDFFSIDKFPDLLEEIKKDVIW